MKRYSTWILLAIGVFMTTACAPAVSTPVTSAVEFNGAKLNLNTVSGDELLATIPGFGSRMVREFQEYRPYISIQEFRQQIGKYVDDAQVSEYEKYVYVPVSINESDSETLQQIPGLDATEAETLLSNRPYASAEVFLSTLGGFISPGELEIAKSYLENTP